MVATLAAVRGGVPAPVWKPEAIASDWENQEVSTGIPIMAMQFDGDMILEAMTDKLTPIHGGIFCCHSGSAADTQAEADAVTYQLGLHSVELTEPPRVHMAANLLKEMWGQVSSVPMEGMMVRKAFTTGDSGSSYIYGYVEATYQEGMTKKECLQSTASTLSLAKKQDGSSSSMIRLAAIAQSGVEWQVLGDEIVQFTIATLSSL
ncbi:hypothetical protein FD755_004116 [Muntiacus reevesi]|uniref:proteasome endopeptidase complex n=1 Tax=Muntiacus reevesi TaxID=9886 RepID=A0A5J5MPL4_MUNRE|nr:hypothetical protein FD755_004116 [Muntiacus reevesi]